MQKDCYLFFATNLLVIFASMIQGNELRDKLNAMLLNKKEMAEELGIGYYDLVRFLNGVTTNLTKPQLEKVQRYFANDKH